MDEGTWTRGRGWALSIALVALPYYRDMNEQITAWAKHAIAQVVDDIRTEP
ncbi:aminoglycoside phosphotransferase [Rhodococcus qingshengii]|uniref:aminoglycoside phosphotransferase n=1 Tax=Rhodococcus qingshengii TaxID=334542 RepID=UPI0035A71C78